MQRQSWPRAWLFTDERMGEGLGPAIMRAAEGGAGVIVRHHASGAARRHEIARLVSAAGALLGISRDAALATELGAALVHNPVGGCRDLPFSLSVHDEEQALAAALRKPSLVFVSPLFATRSHPDAPVLGEEEGRRLAAMAGCPAYALGGVDRELGKELITRGWAGWAGIDAWL